MPVSFLLPIVLTCHPFLPAVLPFASKRKAAVWAESDDSENVDPHQSAKRAKGADGTSGNMLKKPAFTLTKASLSVPSISSLTSASTSSSIFASTLASTSPRAVLKPRAPSAKKFNTSPSIISPIRSSSPLTSSSSLASSSRSSAPSFSLLAGRSPIRASRRGGILTSKRRATSGVGRVSPPPRRGAAASASNLGAAAPFSLDAALKGTLSSYDARLAASALPTTSLLDETTGLDASWEFTIHEDTPEQELTNLLQHSTCVLDISSDEESEQKARRDRAEGRDKENIPPPNDVSQTSAARRDLSSVAVAGGGASTDEMMSVDKARNPLSQLNAADFYAEGCDEASVVLVASDEAEEEEQQQEQQEQQQDQQQDQQQEQQQELVRPSLAALLEEEIAVETMHKEETILPEASETLEAETAVEDIMSSRENPACAAALFQPIEGTGESFQLWESSSQKEEEEDL